MLGLLRGRKDSAISESENRDVAKLFFDSFSKRLRSVEEGLRGFSSEIDKVRSAVDHSQISDLVLLDRLEKTEVLLKEAMSWIRRIAETSSRNTERRVHTSLGNAATETLGPIDSNAQSQTIVSSGTILTPIGDLGTLPSITTPTELEVLTLLANEGPMSAPGIGRVVRRSREHTARLMKKLFDEGYILRDQSRVPFRYSLVEKVKQSFVNRKAKVEAEEAISLPQT